MFKLINFYGRQYKLYSDGTLIRCAYDDVRIQKLKDKKVYLNRHNNERTIKWCLDKDGYYNVLLTGNHHYRKFKLHHLVYIVWIMDILDIKCDINYIGYNFSTKCYTQINHIDSNKLNNCYTNLELVTLKDNIRKACDAGIHNSQTKAVYVQIFYNDKLIHTSYKLRTACQYILDTFGLKLNSGTLSKYVKNNQVWRNHFKFKYIKKCNDYPYMEYNSSELEAEANLDKVKDIV